MIDDFIKPAPAPRFSLRDWLTSAMGFDAPARGHRPHNPTPDIADAMSVVVDMIAAGRAVSRSLALAADDVITIQRGAH